MQQHRFLDSAGEDVDGLHVLCGVQVNNILGSLASVSVCCHIKTDNASGSTDYPANATVGVQLHFGDVLREQKPVINRLTGKSLYDNDTLVVLVHVDGKDDSIQNFRRVITAVVYDDRVGFLTVFQFSKHRRPSQ